MQRYILHAHLQGRTHLQAEEQTVEQKAAHSLAERREGGGNAREWRIRRVSAGERERSPGSPINGCGRRKADSAGAYGSDANSRIKARRILYFNIQGFQKKK